MTKISFRAMRSGAVLTAVSIVAIGALFSACSSPATPPPGGPPPTTLPPGAVNVAYICQGVGFAAGPPLAVQSVGIAVTAPATVNPGQVFTVTANIAPITITPTNVVDLNAVGVVGAGALTITGGTGGAAAGAPVYFNGALAYIPAATASITTTAPSAGSVTIELGTISMLVGSTGFVCTLDTGATPAGTSVSVL